MSYPVSDTYPPRIHLGYASDTYQKVFRLNINMISVETWTSTYKVDVAVRPNPSSAPHAMEEIVEDQCMAAMNVTFHLPMLNMDL